MTAVEAMFKELQAARRHSPLDALKMVELCPTVMLYLNPSNPNHAIELLEDALYRSGDDEYTDAALMVLGMGSVKGSLKFRKAQFTVHERTVNRRADKAFRRVVDDIFRHSQENHAVLRVTVDSELIIATLAATGEYGKAKIMFGMPTGEETPPDYEFEFFKPGEGPWWTAFWSAQWVPDTLVTFWWQTPQHTIETEFTNESGKRIRTVASSHSLVVSFEDA